MSSYTVVFRTGGRDNFQWKRVLTNFSTREEADLKKQEIEEMGYPCLVFDTHRLNNIGLPETYSKEDLVCELYIAHV
jgi:hypothetical protein